MNGDNHGADDVTRHERRLLAERVLEARLRQAATSPRGEPLGEPSAALSSAEERMWFLHEMDPGSAAYNISTATRLSGALQIPAVAAALRVLVDRHPALRSSFPCDGRPRRLVHPAVRADLDVVDLTDADATKRRSLLDQHLRAAAARPFDLDSAPLFRSIVVRLDTAQYVLAFVFHHIIMDGWSVGIFNREFAAAYTAALTGREPEFPPAGSPADLALREQDWLRSAAGHASLEYWARQLAELPAVELPMARTRRPVARFVGGSCEAQIAADVADRLEHLARQNGATLFMVLAASFGVLLHRYSGQEDIVLGSPVANRADPAAEHVIGLFVNSVALRLDLSGSPSLAEVLRRTRAVTLAALEHQQAPFERVVERLVPERALSHTPLIQVMFALQNVAAAPPDLPELTAAPEPIVTDTVRFDLECTLWRRPDGLRIRLLYNVDIMDEDTAGLLVGHYLAILRALPDACERPLAELPILTTEERRRLDIMERAPAPPGPALLLHQLVEEQADANPEAVALRARSASLTFSELERRSNIIANYLRNLGLGRGEVVGVCVPRGIDFVVAILAVLKAGAAFLPLNPDHPDERLRFILDDAGARFVLAEAAMAARIGQTTATVVDISAAGSSRLPYGNSRPPCAGTPADLAYLIYTSGTTGRPKGVQVEHRNVVNTLQACQKYLRLGITDRGLVLAAETFDVCYFELFSAMLAGGESWLVTSAELYEPERVTELLTGATCFQAVPGLMEHLFTTLRAHGISHCPRIRHVITGGDLVPPRLLDTLNDFFPNAQVIITYGPTEAAIFSSIYLVGRDSPHQGHPIGRPLPGTVLRVADRLGQQLPAGFDGEIWIGGAGVSRGYLNRPAETAARFIQVDGERYYRSGDRGRLGPDGGVEFLGRSDEQVKIRGFRIELGEVEAVLSAAPGVKQAVTVVRGDHPSSRRLDSYVLPEDGVLAGHTDGQGQAKLTQWRELFDATYSSRVRAVTAERDFTGWNSSYDGAPIPAEQMNGWADGTLAQIRARLPDRSGNWRVLEIGCGTGLVLLDLAPDCERYVGTDFSQRVLADLSAIVRRRGLTQVELVHALAEQPPAGDLEFDAVIINSVVQYLTDAEHLRRLLVAALARTRPGGFVFIGDVRSLPLLRIFHASVEAAKAPSDPAALLFRRGNRRADSDDELTVHPGYFQQVSSELPLVARVEVEPRRGEGSNELTRYRYDAVLWREGAPAAVQQATWQQWGAAGWTTAKLVDTLTLIRPRLLGLLAIPNGLLDDDLSTYMRLAAAAGQPSPLAPPGERVIPEQLRRLAERSGYRLALSCLRGAADGSFDACFVRSDAGLVACPAWPPSRPADDPLVSNPLRGMAERQFVTAVRQYAATLLPDYMLPATVTVLDLFPLSSHGKVDREALPEPAIRGAAGNRLPDGAAEKLVADAWGDVLGGVEPMAADDFFEIGGTSLLAIQLAVALRARGCIVNPRQVFELRTVEQLAKCLAPGQGEREAVPDGGAAVTPAASMPTSAPITREGFTASGSHGGSITTEERPAGQLPAALSGQIPSLEWRNGRSVLLTGATGILGVHFLHDLLATSVNEIICPVRARSDQDAGDRLAAQYQWYFSDLGSADFANRVVVVAGDMTRPDLGLAADTWNTLAECCDCIINAAADVRHVADRNEIFATNLDGTRALLKLATVAIPKVFYQISTVGVKGMAANGARAVVLREQDLDVGQRATEAYSESKLAAERAVRSFFDAGGTGSIFRVGTIGPHSETGRFQRNIDAHFFSRYVRSILELKVASDWPGREFALIPVDVMTKIILRLAAIEAQGRTFHIQTPYVLSHYDVVRALQAIGYPIRLMEQSDFSGVLTEFSRDPGLAAAVGRLLPLLDQPSDRPVRLDSNWTWRLLRGMGLAFPAPTTRWFNKFVDHGVSVGYFPAPPGPLSGRVPEVWRPRPVPDQATEHVGSQ